MRQQDLFANTRFLLGHQGTWRRSKHIYRAVCWGRCWVWSILPTRIWPSDPEASRGVAPQLRVGNHFSDNSLKVVWCRENKLKLLLSWENLWLTFMSFRHPFILFVPLRCLISTFTLGEHDATTKQPTSPRSWRQSGRENVHRNRHNRTNSNNIPTKSKKSHIQTAPAPFSAQDATIWHLGF